MAHRGRLNVLVNVLGKSPGQLFSEFEGKYDDNHAQGSGDVKYHKGFSADLRTPGGNVHVALAFNPSHLEIVDPVVEGSVRARQERRGDAQGDKVVPVLMHGDAAFAGQGVVMETLQLSQARGYGTGGTVHIIINNQIGFTTSDPRDARSTMYCSDVAKMLEAPIFHVNADDPEAVVFVTRLALRYRQRFHKDVVIDLVCYRRLGHNEADEPAATQPLMYQAIRQHPTVRKLYADRLVAEGVLTGRRCRADGRTISPGARRRSPGAASVAGHDRQQVHRRLDALRQGRLVRARRHRRRTRTAGGAWPAPHRSTRKASRCIRAWPRWWPTAPRCSPARCRWTGAAPRPWPTPRCSMRASRCASPARTAGAAPSSIATPCCTIRTPAAVSSLCSTSGMGSRASRSSTRCCRKRRCSASSTAIRPPSPDCLVIWEAQFGDFVNGAQVVIDQFISSGEAKWGRLCGLTLFLPHGYEGQGPEHSSARLERFLQLCAEHNMQVCVPSTPAQMFHMLRRQMLRRCASR